MVVYLWRVLLVIGCDQMCFFTVLPKGPGISVGACSVFGYAVGDCLWYLLELLVLSPRCFYHAVVYWILCSSFLVGWGTEDHDSGD